MSLDPAKRIVRKDIKVVGIGCANCRNTIALVEAVAKEKSVEVTLEKVEDMAAIIGCGVMSTPGVVIDDAVIHASGVPSRRKVESWF